jgi:hypothetical protein
MSTQENTNEERMNVVEGDSDSRRRVERDRERQERHRQRQRVTEQHCEAETRCQWRQRETRESRVTERDNGERMNIVEGDSDSRSRVERH